MPVPLAPIIIPAAASVIGSGINALSQSGANRAGFNFSTKQWHMDRAAAIADWNAQNLYNSPAEQMKRLRAAGLNPNLVYGNGATTTAGAIRSTDSPHYNPTAPQWGSGLTEAARVGMAAYQDTRLQDQQVQNMEAQRRNMELDSILKTIQISSDQIKGARNELELGKARQLYDTSIATAEERLRAITSQTDIKISEEVRNAAMHAPNLLSALERVANIGADTALKKQQLENLRSSNVLQQMEIAMRKLGLSYNDSVILRMLSQFAEGKSLPELLRSLWDQLKQSGVSPTSSKSTPSGVFGIAPVGLGTPAENAKKWMDDFNSWRSRRR